MTCSGCLVTDRVTWRETTVPPIIQEESASPRIGSILWLNKNDVQRTEWAFSVFVQEADSSRVLSARWRIVTRNDTMPTFTQLEPLPAGKTLRELTFKVGSNQLSDGECHHLELAVSGSFVAMIDPRTGKDATEWYWFDVTTLGKENDVGFASWWIWEGRGSVGATPEEKVRLVESCNALESTPASSSTVMEAPQ